MRERSMHRELQNYFVGERYVKKSSGEMNRSAQVGGGRTVSCTGWEGAEIDIMQRYSNQSVVGLLASLKGNNEKNFVSREYPIIGEKMKILTNSFLKNRKGRTTGAQK